MEGPCSRNGRIWRVMHREPCPCCLLFDTRSISPRTRIHHIMQSPSIFGAVSTSFLDSSTAVSVPSYSPGGSTSDPTFQCPLNPVMSFHRSSTDHVPSSNATRSPREEARNALLFLRVRSILLPGVGEKKELRRDGKSRWSGWSRAS